ncbi:hypothetical protein RB653_005331 [Dictyostelium firmibasis]|uniref:Uncharacterized protein n=1 Tax=Dictyostelium firmibasis TaxID=79012 RepID=A0AAN7U790_9MYCE
MNTYDNNNEIKHISNKWIFEKEDLIIESRVITGTIPEDILIFVNGQPTKRVVFEKTSLVCSFSYKNDRFTVTPPHVLSKDSQRRLYRNGVDVLNGEQFEYNEHKYIFKIVAASALMIPLFPLIVAKAISVHQDKVIHVTKDYSKSNNDNILYQQTKFVFVDKKFNFLQQTSDVETFNTENIFNNNNNINNNNNDANSINYIDSR